MKQLLWLLLFFSSDLMADPRICVRNFAANEMDVCSLGTSTRHKYVVQEALTMRPICSLVYDDERCKFDKQEFAHAITPDGQIVCVMYQNQPGIGSNFCAALPENYSYVLDPWM